ncbi:MAG: succinate dehydrogenase [Deltaproteobacteria bacterium]|nr:succinate dehydrogenase [Deltaproteobacteria bacterium]
MDWWKWSPAFLILWIPGGFRITCYYYRKAYYRSFFLHPMACSVGDQRANRIYNGEAKLPWLFQNVHRYFLYLALFILIPLWLDVLRAFNFGGKFGVGVGTLVLLVNTVLLSGYTLSCHSLRHLVGGKLDCFSCAPMGKLRHGIWERLSRANHFHMVWAWTSLFMVGFADLYVRLCSMGVWIDFKLL